MTNDARIEALLNRLPQLAAWEKALRQESNTVCYHSPGRDGQPEFHIADEVRFQQIGQELAAIAEERARINGKLQKLEDLLGQHLLVPSGGGDYDFIQRQKVELGNYYFHKVLTMNRGWLLPEEAITDKRYLAKKAKIMPVIEAAEARIERANQRAAEADAILAE